MLRNLYVLDRVFAKTVDKPGNMAYDTYSKNPIWAIGIERSGDHAYCKRYSYEHLLLWHLRLSMSASSHALIRC